MCVALKHPRFNRHKSNHNFQFSILHSQLANARYASMLYF